MKKLDKYKQFLATPDRSLDYWTEGAVLDFTEELATIMAESGISRSELANRIGTSKAYITKVFSGEANFTMETMAKFALAVDHAIRIHLAPMGMHTVWIDRRMDKSVVTYSQPANVVNLDVVPSVSEVTWKQEATSG